ncbi:MAG: hypothetical protein AB9907_05250 [Flexilinea sp.]
MQKSDAIRRRTSISHIHDKFEYYGNIPEKGFFINGRPGVGGYLQPWNIEKTGIF